MGSECRRRLCPAADRRLFLLTDGAASAARLGSGKEESLYKACAKACAKAWSAAQPSLGCQCAGTPWAWILRSDPASTLEPGRQDSSRGSDVLAGHSRSSGWLLALSS